MSAGLLVRPRAVARNAVVASVEDVSVEPRAGADSHVWALDDLRRLVRTLALSGTGLVVAWLVASGTTDPARQEQAVAGGIVATAVGVAGFTGWLLGGMRTVRGLRADAVQDVRCLLAQRAPAVDVPVAAGDLVTADGMTHYHSAGCLMVRGKAVRAVGADGRDALLRCPVCLPEEGRS